MGKPFPANPVRLDPYKNFKFRLEIDGITRAGFRECSGLGHEAAEPARTLPGQTKHSNITLKMGMTVDRSLWDWHQATAAGKTERRNGSIVLMDDAKPVEHWNFKEGWPMKWTGPTFNATGNEVTIETLEISHEGLTKASV